MKPGNRYIWTRNGEQVAVEITGTDSIDYDTSTPCVEFRDIATGHHYNVLATDFAKEARPGSSFEAKYRLLENIRLRLTRTEQKIFDEILADVCRTGLEYACLDRPLETEAKTQP